METSWVSALEPDLVATDRLPDESEATIPGIYGPNPRMTVDAERGAAQIDAAAALLAERVAARLRGERLDPLADLRTFVARYWPERLVLAGRARARDGPSGAVILLTNPGAVSRYLSGLELVIDGATVPPAGLALVNRTAGEPGVPLPVAELGPERGFYVRRRQTAELRLPMDVVPGPHEVRLDLSLAGVSEARYTEIVDFS
jgi:hypothetical protein